MTQHARHPLAAGIGLALALGGSQAWGAGFLVPEISVFGLGTANAVVANTDALGAIAYNPALSSFHAGTTVSGGLMVVHAKSRVTPTNGIATDFQGQDNVAIPMLQITHQATDDLTLGFGLTVPLGLSTEYPVGTFGTFSDLGVAALHPTKSKVEVVDLSPTLAYRLNENMSVAVGLDYYRLREVVFNTAGVSNEGDGHGWGWNASFAYERGPWSLGATFRSRSEIEIDGTTTLTGLGLSAPASADLVMPWRAQIGIRYKATDALGLEFDVSRTGWNSFDVLTIENDLVPVISTNNWEDNTAYRLGATYQLSPATELRFGYSYDEEAGDLSYYSARTADSNRHLFSIGVGHDLGDGLMLEAGYMYVNFQDVNLEGRSFAAQLVGGDTDPNGTDAFDGKYETTVHLFGLGLSKQFN
jgi:long-chain fatty acid transport protein